MQIWRAIYAEKVRLQEKSEKNGLFFCLCRKKSVSLQTIAHKMKELLVVIGLLGAAFLLLSVRVLLKRGGRFSSEHISQNKLMRRRGIHCATSQDREARRENGKKIDVKSL